MRSASWLLLPLLATASASCTWFKANQDVLVTSDPAGAHVLLDGLDTGLTTPARLDIAGNYEGDHQLELVKKGYRPERRMLMQHTIFYGSKWIDGAAGEDVIPLPIFWTMGDFLTPFGVRGAIVPGELFVKLYAEDAPLLGFDFLARQQAAAGTATTGTSTGK